MSDQEIVKKHISEDASNFDAVFQAALDAQRGVLEGRYEAREAEVSAKNGAVAQRMLETDIRGRLANNRLWMKTVNQQSIEAPKTAA